MRIILVCDVILDGRDAQTTHILELFNNLSKLEAVYLFAPKPKEIKFESQSIKYIPRLDIPKLGLVSYQIALFLNLCFYCKKMRIDGIYARQSDLTFLSLITSKLFRIPYFVEVNGLIIDEMKVYNRLELHLQIAKLSEKLNYKNAKKIVAVTQGVKEGIRDLYDISDNKIVVIENGANTDLFRQLNKKKCINGLKLNECYHYLCFVGNLSPWQGVEYLIRSAPLILEKFPKTKFLIVGDGMMKEELINLAAKLGVFDNFIFTGAVAYEEVPLYINASDVGVAPSTRDDRNKKSGGSSLKIYEYLACGKPVVTGDIDGDKDLIIEANAGYVVSPENTIELANAIIKLLKNKELREEMGKNGRKCVVKNHSWEAVARRVAEVCNEVIGGRK